MSLVSDTHGRVIERLSHIENCYAPEETAIIILGDAGINFYLNKTDAKNKKAINRTGYLIYCVRGNHEERPENIPTMYQIYDENVEGRVYYEVEYPNIRYLIDGHAYLINMHPALVIGGAYSVDKWYRLSRFPQAAKNRTYTQERNEKISNSLKQKFIDNPELRDERSQKLKQAYQDGHRDEAMKKTLESRRQPVAKYDKNGQLLAIFPTAVAAYREFCPEAKTDKAIYRVLNGQRSSYKGFIYKRIDKKEE